MNLLVVIMSFQEEIVVKKRLSELADAIRSKYQSLKKNEINFQMNQQKKFKPLIETLEKNGKTSPNTTLRANIPVQNVNLPPLALRVTPSLIVDDKKFSLEKIGGMWYPGKHPATFTSSEIYLCGKMYKSTGGLISLLTKKKPSNYSESDLANYRQMLQDTAHHLTLSGTNIKFRKGHKYENIIKPLFPSLPLRSKVNTPSPFVTSTPLQRSNIPNLGEEHNSSVEDAIRN